jgi:ankyrin repeat protein
MDDFKEELKDAICNDDIAFLKKNRGKYTIDERFPDEDNDTLLLYSISDPGSNSYEYFLENNADVTLVNDLGENVIHSIVFSGDKERMLRLLNKDNINHQSKDGSTPLYLAILIEKYEMAQILIKGGADVNIPNYEKDSPIHLACYFGNMQMVQELVNSRANLFAKNDNGNLPFALAVNKGHDDIVRFLYKKIYL